MQDALSLSHLYLHKAGVRPSSCAKGLIEAALIIWAQGATSPAKYQRI